MIKGHCGNLEVCLRKAGIKHEYQMSYYILSRQNDCECSMICSVDGICAQAFPGCGRQRCSQFGNWESTKVASQHLLLRPFS